MKKLLGVLLAIAMSWPAGASVLKNVEVVGEVQTIASDVTHQIDNEGEIPHGGWYNSGAWTRAMAGLSADLVEDVTANLLFQYAYMWGDNNEEGFGFSDADGVKLVNANVVLHNLFCAFDLTVGRQFYGDEDSAVMYFGPNHYNAEAGAYAQALDAAKLVYSDDVKTFTLLAGKVADSDDGWDDWGNNYQVYENAAIFGADLKVNVTDFVKLQGYIYDISNDTRYIRVNGNGPVVWVEDRDDQNNGFWGAKVTLAPSILRLSAEYTRNFGGHRLIKEHNKADGGKGHMFKLDVAADMDMVTARGAFLYANENFWAMGNYTPGLLIGHLLEGELWDYSDDGVRMFNVGADVKLFEKWTVSLDGFVFQDSRGHRSGSLESDLTVKYDHNEYVQLFAGAGYVKYGTSKDRDDLVSERIADRKDNVKGQVGMLIRF